MNTFPVGWEGAMGRSWEGALTLQRQGFDAVDVAFTLPTRTCVPMNREEPKETT
jgi:hypothetical protein